MQPSQSAKKPRAATPIRSRISDTPWQKPPSRTTKTKVIAGCRHGRAGRGAAGSDREQGSSGRSRSSSSDHDMPERNSRGEFMSNSESDRGSSGRSSSSNGSSSRGSSGSSRSSSSSHHQGEVRDPEHDGRLKENRDRGVSMHANDRYDERSSSNRSSSSRSRMTMKTICPRRALLPLAARARVKCATPEHDGRLKENRDRGVSKGSDERSSSSRSSSRSR